AAAQPEKMIDQEKDVKQVEATPLEEKVPSDEVTEVAQSTPDVALKEDVSEGVVDQNPEIGGLSTDLAKDKKKRDNLSRLLDRNRCYGCDLSGLDLSKKDFQKADLEKADLSGCNLAGADLEKANLKGAILQNADIRNADLRKTDFYKADLTGADLTGSKMTGAMFDGAILEGSQGIDNNLMTTN
ncbi:MAG: pentapeptide repeat-containing protein, partial [Desulforhopalus sp.]